MNHVMIDIETMGTGNDAVICSIGAVKFNPDTGEIKRVDEFYELVHWVGQNYRVIDADTVVWWLKQDELARHALLDDTDRYPLRSTLCELNEWLPLDAFLWSNGKEFDIEILEHAFKQASLDVPWKYYEKLDCRTIEAAASGIVERNDVPRTGTHHNALDDAIYQATYVSAMWQALRKNAAPGAGDCR